MDAYYWAYQIEEPVLMDTALGALAADVAPTHLIEIGPRGTLLQIAARGGRAAAAEFLHPAPGAEATGRELAATVAALYRGGLDPLWEELYEPGHRVVEALGPYVFSSAQRHWDRQAFVHTAQPPRPGPTPPGPSRRSPRLSRPAAEPGARAGAHADDPVLLAVVQAVTEVGGYPRNASCARPASTRTSASTR